MTATPPAQALKLILHGPSNVTNTDIVIIDYGDLATFSALWLQGLESGKVSIGGQEIDFTDSSRQFLLIGNDPPVGVFDTKIPSIAGINFRSHFTATSWLAAWKVKYSPAQKEKDESRAIESGTRFAVIDPRPVDSYQGAARALQTILGARGASSQSPVPGATVLNEPTLTDICQWLKPAKTDSRTIANDAPHLRDLLKSTIWNELVSTSEKHHALSNILGPVILSGRAEPFPPVLGHETLLRRLLSTCGLVSWQDAHQGPSTDRANRSVGNSPPPESGKGLSILLLDDQAKQGWESWVTETLPDAATKAVAVDPEGLVDAITIALESIKNDDGIITGYKSKDARFRLELPDLEGASHPILLLDLRLFSGNEKAEREFLKNKLLPLVDHFTDKSNLVWPGFSSESLKFKRARAAVVAGNLSTDTHEHHEVITWLPRVVALADMSLPIILFSSTGRRDLVEPFKTYGNIITSFEKPRLNDLAALGKDDAITNIRASTALALRESVDRASKWLKFRDAGRTALEAHTTNPLKAPEINREVMKHFEIYFDESGSTREDGFRVAALVVGYKSEEQAVEVAKKMHDAGISWFHEDKKNGTFIFDKTASRDPQNVSVWSNHFTPFLKELWVAPFVLWADAKKGSAATDSFNADTLIQSLVGQLAEIALFVLIPYNDGQTYFFYGAKRRIEIEGSRYAVDWRNEYSQYEGKDISQNNLHDIVGSIPSNESNCVDKIRAFKGISDDYIKWRIEKDATNKQSPRAIIKAMFLSINSGQEYAGIIARTFQTRPWIEPWCSQAKKTAARFAPLNHDGDATLDEHHRPIHIIADFLPGDATWSPSPTLGAAATMLPDNGSPAPILIAEGLETSLLLGICRALDGGDYALALASAAKLENTCESHATWIYKAVRDRLAGNLEKIEGSHLIGALHHYAILPNGKEGNLPYSCADIRHQHWTRYPSQDSKGIKSLAGYSSNRIIVDLGVSCESMEKNVAEYLLRQILQENRISTDVGEIDWWKDKGWRFDRKSKKIDEPLFAIVRFDEALSDPGFWRSTMKIPSSLRVDDNLGDLTIWASGGKVPTGRLVAESSGNVIFYECEKADLENREWTKAQIEAVLKSDLKRVYSGHLQNESKLKSLSKWPDKARWLGDGSGSYILFLENSLISQVGLVGKACSCEDFDESGEILYQQTRWPIALDSSPFDRYRISRYENETHYKESGARWDGREADGFYVRRSRSGKIWVFADTKEVDQSELVAFSEPIQSSFKENGEFCGDPWSPNVR